LKIKLVIVTEIIAPYRIPVFNALAQREEIDLHVIFLSENDPTLRQWLVYKDEIKFPYSVLPSCRRRIGKHNLLLNRGLRSALNRINPDAVICGGYNYVACWAAARWAKSRRVPVLLWTESTAFDLRDRHALVELAKKYFLSLCDAFVVPGKSSREYLQELGIEESRIVTAPNAVDNLLFSQTAISARKDQAQIRTRHRLPARYFLCVGRLIREKGIFDLLDAYASLNAETRSSVGLVFVGEGADSEELRSNASPIAPGIIHFLGFIHREQLPEIYALAEAFFFPTHSDPWGLVVNEALACGLPVICSSVAGCAADLIKHGSNGFVVPPRDPVQLSAVMETVAADSGLRTEMGRRSREQIDAYSPALWADGIAKAVRLARHPKG
jgi:glycosyltransferase involved in cell wall biosynthesis